VKNSSAFEAKGTSLRKRLLLTLLPGLILSAALAATASYSFINRPLRAAFDQSLSDTALALIPYIHSPNGVLSLQLSKEAEKILRSDEFETVSYAVFDSTNKFAAGDEHLVALFEKVRASIQANQSANVDDRSFHDLNFKGNKIRVLMMPVSKAQIQATVIVAETTVKRQQRDLELAFGLFAPLGILAVTTGLTVWWGTRRGLSPIHKLSNELSQRSLNNLSPLNEPMLVEELRPLVHSLNDLFSRLNAAQDEQAQFIADAAHQLRTPLAGLSMTLELASKGTEAERTSRLAQAKLATQRTIHLAQQLLMLSAVQSSVAANDDFVIFELSELIQELAPNWAVKAEVHGIECNFSLSSCMAFGQRTMIGEAISNLVDNALVYCPVGSQVSIACGSEGEGTQSFFEVMV
jgi:two-component system, OmpR family, sensor histidine kinase TctE